MLYERDAWRYWDEFYRRNGDRFFRDRHYFEREFPSLLRAASLLEVGCGVGNSLLPLLALNRDCTAYACDFSPAAIELLRAAPAYAAAGPRVHAFVADVTRDALSATIPPRSLDAASMVFVLSALSPGTMRAALLNVASVLRVGGRVLFRDYARGDVAQDRLAARGKRQQIDDAFFVRGDGTRAFYFTPVSARRGREEGGQ